MHIIIKQSIPCIILNLRIYFVCASESNVIKYDYYISICHGRSHSVLLVVLSVLLFHVLVLQLVFFLSAIKKLHHINILIYFKIY